MNILMISNLDNDEKLEDVFDICLRRNTWSSEVTEEKVGEKYVSRIFKFC